MCCPALDFARGGVRSGTDESVVRCQERVWGSERDNDTPPASQEVASPLLPYAHAVASHALYYLRARVLGQHPVACQCALAFAITMLLSYGLGRRCPVLRESMQDVESDSQDEPQYHRAAM
eukprot:3407666-Rhodomonas_salina.1